MNFHFFHNTKIASIALFILIVSCFSCNKFVNKIPQDQFTSDIFWTSEQNVQTYSWEFYNLFTGFGTGASGDFYFSSFNDDQAANGFQKFPLNVPASDASWTFSYIRKANILLENVDAVPMDDVAKNHWKGVAHFFRALQYFNLVKRFGDVPWINKSLDISESDIIYKPRDPHKLVMDSVVADINFAVNNLKGKGSTDANTVNADVALALKARICLYEGTYRKYHTELKMSGADDLLMQAQDASKKIIESGAYKLMSDFRAAYSSLDLSGNTEMILYKQYVAGQLSHSVIGYTNSSTTMNGLSKNAVEAFVCSDGLPIKLSSLYKGDDNIEDIRNQRDGRLLETIDTFLCYKGHLVNGLSSSTGYRPSKFLQPADANQLAPYNTTDAPLFWLPEIYLIYAESSAELDDLGKYTLTQNDLNISVNLLRARAGVASLQVNGHQGTAINDKPFTDPVKDPDVPSLIWEIRRERRAELMMCGFRFDDLMRWKKGVYMDDTKNLDIDLGAKVSLDAEVPQTDQGYIYPYKGSGLTRPFIDPKNYLSPIPSGQITLYPPDIQSGMQNPDW